MEEAGNECSEARARTRPRREIGPIISTGYLHVVVEKFIVHKYMYILVN
jgi:hypothetical protein